MRRNPAFVLLLCLVCLCGLAAGCSKPPPAYKTSHREVPAVAPLAKKGPPAGTYRSAGRPIPLTDAVPGLADSDEVVGSRYVSVGGNVVVGLRDGIRAYSARTGAPGWQYRQPGRAMWAWVATGGVVVAQLHAKGDDPRPEAKRIVGLDAASGRLLWEKAEPGWELLNISAGETDPDAGIVAVKASADDENGERHLLGIDARSGDDRWSKPTGAGAQEVPCPKAGDLVKGGAAEHVVPVEFECAEDDVLVGFDAKSGEPRWSKDLPPNGFQTVGGATLLRRTTDLELIGHDGKAWHSTPALAECGSGGSEEGCPLFVTGGRVVLSYVVDGSRSTTLVAVDPRTGKVKQLGGSLRGGEVLTDARGAGGKVYAQIRSEGFFDPFRPMRLAAIDVRTGRASRSVLPYAEVGFHSSYLANLPGPRLWQVGGGRLFFETEDPVTERPRLVSLASRGERRPTALGGTRPEDWPDPCELTKGLPAPYDGAAVKRRPAESLAFNGVRIAPIVCHLDLPDGRDASVRINWVAGSPGDAARLLPDSEPIETTWSGIGSGRTMRVGRAIVSVLGGVEEQESIESTVWNNLRRLR